MNRSVWRLPVFVGVLAKVYLSAVVVLSFFRLVLFLYAAPDSLKLFDGTTLIAFRIGLQFDSVILAYILALPLVLLFVQSQLANRSKVIPYFVILLLTLLLPVLILLVIADIPYFTFFNNRITESAFQWMSSPKIVFGMIAGNIQNLIFLIVAILAFSIGAWKVNKSLKHKLFNADWEAGKGLIQRLVSVVSFLLMGALCFFGLRGRMDAPIRTGDAFYCTDPFLNQLGLNPGFTLMKSLAEKVNLMDEQEAIRNTREYLAITENLSESPIARMVKADSAAKRYNVVLVLMESMSADYMGTFGNKKGLTPNLDSLAKQSMFFNNAYSSGIHTSNGIFASLYSFPALKRIRPMSAVPARTFSGIPYTLKQQGYHNLFFSTHGFSFDNLGTFIPHNFFDELYTAENYPQDKLIGPFGVPDDYLFKFSLNKLRETAGKGKPFFATLLTTSNHDPYILPDYYKSDLTDNAERAVSYADWSIGQFLEGVKKEAWFSNTIFVFVADHGLKVGESPYDLVRSYNHIPIMFYAPGILGEPKTMENFIGQVDIYPTLMSLLNVSYVNSTLGVDALKSPRDKMFFSADSKIGCINKDWMYVYRFGGDESLYDYKSNDATDHAKKRPQDVAELKKYCLSNIQTAEWIISHDKTSLVPLKQ